MGEGDLGRHQAIDQGWVDGAREPRFGPGADLTRLTRFPPPTRSPADENWQRYKIIVQVVIGEQRGEGVNMAARCFWDAHADDHAMDTFKNESIFCVAAAFGAYFP